MYGARYFHPLHVYLNRTLRSNYGEVRRKNNMFKATHISPMIPSYQVSGTRDFFKELLKFEVTMDSPEYCVVSLGEFEIHIQKAGENIGEMSFYMSVDDVDAVWNLIKEKKENLKIREPFEQPYGMKEIHVVVPNTEALMFIGQPVEQGNGGNGLMRHNTPPAI